MTIPEIIGHLRHEQRALESAIKELETLARLHSIAGTEPGRRGRKSMGQEERQEVSRRMRNYWAGRRKARTA